MVKMLVKLSLVAICLIWLHIHLDGGYDVDTVKEYFESAVEIDIRTEGNIVRNSLKTDTAIRAEILRLVRTSGCFRVLGDATGKYVVANDVILHLPDGKNVVIAVSRFPCIVVDNHVIAVSASLYNKLLRGAL